MHQAFANFNARRVYPVVKVIASTQRTNQAYISYESSITNNHGGRTYRAEIEKCRQSHRHTNKAPKPKAQSFPANRLCRISSQQHKNFPNTTESNGLENDAECGTQQSAITHTNAPAADTKKRGTSRHPPACQRTRRSNTIYVAQL